MGSKIETVGADSGAYEEQSMPQITVLETLPDRYVFTEDGNTDGWIATDATVDPVA